MCLYSYTILKQKKCIYLLCSVALVVLLGDGIDSLFPGFDLKTTRLISFFILTPMLFLPIRHLSYTSLLGIISAFSIICVIIYDGVNKETAPGSLIEPAVTKKKIMKQKEAHSHSASSL